MRTARLRPFLPGRCAVLLALFRDTIRRVNSRDYSPAQIAAWASDDIDTVAWFGRFTGRFVPVAEEAGRPVGFAELEPDGHIDRVYVSADHQRRGIGRQLAGRRGGRGPAVGLARLFTEASITARPFFEAQGFAVLAPQVVTCRGAEFVNYRMERVLAEPSLQAGPANEASPGSQSPRACQGRLFAANSSRRCLPSSYFARPEGPDGRVPPCRSLSR